MGSGEQSKPMFEPERAHMETREQHRAETAKDASHEAPLQLTPPTIDLIGSIVPEPASACKAKPPERSEAP